MTDTITIQLPSIDGNIRWEKLKLGRIQVIEEAYGTDQKAYSVVQRGEDTLFHVRKLRSKGHEETFWNHMLQRVPITLNLFEPDWNPLTAEEFFRTKFTLDRWDLKVAMSKCLEFKGDDLCRAVNISKQQLERYLTGGNLYIPQGTDIPAAADIWAGVLAEPANLWKNYNIPARQYWEYWLSSFTH